MPSPVQPALESAAHVIQLALTPVFLLSGIGTLLNVFSSRLARVADQVDRLTAKIDEAPAGEKARLRRRLTYLSHRSLGLDIAVVLGAISGMGASTAALVLFVGAIRSDAPAWLLFTSFAVALAATMGALAAYLVEMLIASRGLREEAGRVSEGGEP